MPSANSSFVTQLLTLLFLVSLALTTAIPVNTTTTTAPSTNLTSPTSSLPHNISELSLVQRYDAQYCESYPYNGFKGWEVVVNDDALLNGNAGCGSIELYYLRKYCGGGSSIIDWTCVVPTYTGYDGNSAHMAFKTRFGCSNYLVSRALKEATRNRYWISCCTLDANANCNDGS